MHVCTECAGLISCALCNGSAHEIDDCAVRLLSHCTIQWADSGYRWISERQGFKKALHTSMGCASGILDRRATEWPTAQTVSEGGPAGVVHTPPDS